MFRRITLIKLAARQLLKRELGNQMQVMTALLLEGRNEHQMNCWMGLNFVTFDFLILTKSGKAGCAADKIGRARQLLKRKLGNQMQVMTALLLEGIMNELQMNWLELLDGTYI